MEWVQDLDNSEEVAKADYDVRNRSIFCAYISLFTHGTADTASLLAVLIQQKVLDMIDDNGIPPCVYIKGFRHLLHPQNATKHIPHLLRLFWELDIIRRRLVVISKNVIIFQEAVKKSWDTDILNATNKEVIATLASDHIDEAYRALYVELVIAFCQLVRDLVLVYGNSAHSS
jgi:hypothetical protein